MAGEESRAAALTFASRVVAGSESVEGDATAALVHGLLYVGDQVGALTGLRLPYTDLTLGDLLAGGGRAPFASRGVKVIGISHRTVLLEVAGGGGQHQLFVGDTLSVPGLDGVPGNRDEQTGEWLAGLPPTTREWVLSFPDDLIGHPLLAAAIERASDGTVVVGSETKAKIVGDIRAFQAVAGDIRAFSSDTGEVS